MRCGDPVRFCLRLQLEKDRDLHKMTAEEVRHGRLWPACPALQEAESSACGLLLPCPQPDVGIAGTCRRSAAAAFHMAKLAPMLSSCEPGVCCSGRAILSRR